LIGKLREAVRQPKTSDSYSDQDYYGEKPDWFLSDKVVLSIEEDKLEDKNRMTLVTILKESKNVKKAKI